jgi:hypothetical protein
MREREEMQAIIFKRKREAKKVASILGLLCMEGRRKSFLHDLLLTMRYDA